MNRSIAIAGLLLCLCAPVQAANIVDGWGGLRIGMSPDQVRAVPGRSWGKFRATAEVGLMATQKPVRQDGVLYDITLTFRPPNALDEIMLSSSKVTTEENCQKIFLDALKHAESSYGVFAPVAASLPVHDTGPGMTNSIEQHDAAGLASHYQIGHAVTNDGSLYVFLARRSEGGQSLEVSADWSAKQTGPAKAECFTKLVYEKSK